jgi:type II secretory pathway component PulF
MPEDGEGPDSRDVREDTYDVTSTDMHGEPSHAQVEAKSVTDLVENLRSKGLQVSSVTGPRARRAFEPRKCSLEEFAFFNAELAAACRRGAPLPGALRALSRDLSGARLRRTLDDVAVAVEGGVGLADALARHSDVFPAGYVTMVSAGIKAGDLAGTLVLLADEARLSADVRHKLIGAVAYPLAVLSACTGVMAFLGWSILPIYAEMYEEMDMGLPTLTRALFALAPLFRWAPAVLAAVLVAFVVASVVVSAGSAGREVLGLIVLHLPFLGRLARATAVARFCRTLACGLRSTMPVPEAISLAGLASGNAAFGAAAEKVRKSVEEGASVSDGMAEIAAIFPSTVVWMLHIAEQRSELAPALEESAKVQEDLARRTGRLIPIVASTFLTLFAAFALAGTGVALLLPLVSVTHGI